VWGREYIRSEEVSCVPVVIVEMWEGRTVEQKEKLIKGITRAFEESLGTKPESLSIVLHDVPKTNWGKGGEQASKLPT
jgi:4-oxalocrotonate tautomerase